MCKSCIDSVGIKKIGRLELIIGCMFAGKTEEFIRRMRRLVYAKVNLVIFKPNVDNRYLNKKIISHNNISIKCEVIKNSQEILTYLSNNKNIKVIGIDELQFFDFKVVQILNKLVDQNYIIIANGLDLNFKGESFLNVKELLPLADYITKLHAICVKCGNYANRTQRIINGKIASKKDPLILIGSNESYEARCRRCFEIN